jgi:hypothetical protein
MAIVVRPGILETKEASIADLYKWVYDCQLQYALTSIIALSVLSAINLFFFLLIDKQKFRFDLIAIPVFDFIILAMGIWIAGKNAEINLMWEIRRSFSML